MVAVIELAQGQRVGAGKADIPIHRGVYAVSRGSPQQSGQVIGQELELHIDSDILPIGLDGSDGVQQIAGIVHSLDGIAAVPPGFREKLAGKVRVVAVFRQSVSLPGTLGHQRLMGCDDSIVPESIDDGIHVNGIPERLADTNILQRVGIGSTAGTVGIGGHCAQGEDDAQREKQAK